MLPSVAAATAASSTSGSCTRAVLRALRHRLRRDRNVLVNALGAGIGPHMDEPYMPREPLAPEDDSVEDDMESYLPRAWDEYAGTLLDGVKVNGSRGVETGFVDELEVWVFRPRAECWTETGRPPMGTRWIDHNKGDEEHGDIRPCLAVQETLRISSIARDKSAAVFAAISPLEAIRVLLSLNMTLPARASDPWVLRFLDISRAHPHCKALCEKLYVELRVQTGCPQGLVGLLVMTLNGLRDAPQAFERKVSIS